MGASRLICGVAVFDVEQGWAVISHTAISTHGGLKSDLTFKPEYIISLFLFEGTSRSISVGSKVSEI